MTLRHRPFSRWALVPLIALLLSTVAVAVPQRAGPVAAFVAVAPVAYGMMVLLLLPLAVLRRDAALAVAVVGAGLLAALVYAPAAAPARVTADDPVAVLTWNLHGEAASSVGLAEAMDRWDPDVVILQEAGADAIGLIPPDMEASHHPDAATPPGMLLATRLPLLRGGTLNRPEGAWDRPRAYWLTLDTGGPPLTVVGAHLSVPFPVSSLPCPYCPSRRDAQVAALTAFAADKEAAGESVVIAGDLNLAEREVAYRDLGSLVDVARGGTWRPLPVSWLPPMLRLDYVFVGRGIAVVAVEIDCAISSSDHCPLAVRLAVPDGRLSRPR
jgi:vancomycin resistance protein VanJ